MRRPPRAQPAGPKSVRGSDAARQKAALLIEAWSGVRTTQSASDAMGVALTRFYQLEARALQLLVSAMEPRPRGRQVTAEGRVQKLEAELKRLQRDVERYQSLYRTAQRTLGLAVAKAPEPEKNAAPGGKRRRGPRKKARGQSVAQVLLRGAAADRPREANDGATESGPGARGPLAGRGRGEVSAEGGAGDDQRRAAGGRSL